MLRRNIPNIITLGNLFCGCMALVFAFEVDLVTAAYLVGLAAVLDFLDGLAARLLKVHSPIGKDLDSLADMVTFGVVPGAVMMMLIRQSLLFGSSGASSFTVVLPYAGFLITVFSCLRLAIFNNDTRQRDFFMGLPTPANAIFVCSLPVLLHLDHSFSFQSADPRLLALILDVNNLCITTGFLCLLMVTDLPLFSLKFKQFGWRGNELRYLFLLLCAVLLVTFREAGVPLVIIAYVALSFVNNIFLKPRA